MHVDVNTLTATDKTTWNNLSLISKVNCHIYIHITRNVHCISKELLVYLVK